MGADSKISWTDHTFNPWWGCSPASAGCANCYAATFAKRVGQDCFGDSPRRFFGDAHWAEPMKWAAKARKAGRRVKVFCGSMCDILEEVGPSGEDPLEEQRSRLYDLIEKTSDDLDWLLLTKRAAMLGTIPDEIARVCWLGVTAENQEAADERIPALLATPARVRFVSCEPLLGAVDLARWCRCQACGGSGLVTRLRQDQYGPQAQHQQVCQCRFGGGLPAMRGLDWVIIGGESGPRARPFDLAWARSLLGQCREAGVACFVKQMGRKPLVPMNMPLPPLGFPFSDRDGREPAEWPVDLRVQGFPEARR